MNRSLMNFCAAMWVLGRTDTNHSRAMLGDLALHYLLPSFDVGVGIESDAGKISAQVCDFAMNSPGEPCPFCDGRIDHDQLAVELMSDEERAQRKEAALDAERRGIDGRQYWRGERPQLLTVGYVTTTVGGLLAGYTIGWLTGAFATHTGISNLISMHLCLGLSMCHALGSRAAPARGCLAGAIKRWLIALFHDRRTGPLRACSEFRKFNIPYHLPPPTAPVRRLAQARVLGRRGLAVRPRRFSAGIAACWIH